VHEKLTRFTVLVLHRRAGKTMLALRLLVDGAIRSTHTASLFAYVAPFLKQAKQISWLTLKQIVEPLRAAGGCEVREGDLEVRFPNGAIVRLYGADNHEALRGSRLDGVAPDELADVAPHVWQDVLRPALSDRLGWALFLGTVSGVDLLSELYHHAGTDKAIADGWSRALWTVHQTDALAKREVEQLERDMPEKAFAREYLCDFTVGGEDQLVSITDVEAAASRNYPDTLIFGQPRVIGVDPARSNTGRCCIARRQGLMALPVISLHENDTMSIATRVAQVYSDWQADAVIVDGGGVGGGVIDRLRQLRAGMCVVEVQFGASASKPDRYVNRRAEVLWELREWLRSGGQIPRDQDLMREIATPRYGYKNGRILIESKDDIKERLPGGQSPDMADALALTLAVPVAAGERHPITGLPMPNAQARARRDRLPFAVRDRRR
jgi:hypothetical protein